MLPLTDRALACASVVPYPSPIGVPRPGEELASASASALASDESAS